MSEDRENLENELVKRLFETGAIREIDPLKPQFNPIELWVVLYAMYTGITLFLAPNQELSIPEYWRSIWRALLFGGSLTILMGMAWRGRSLTSHAVQQIGYLALSVGCMAYGLRTGDPAILLFVPLGIWKVVQIHQRIHEVYPEIGFLSGIKGLVTQWRER